MSKTRFTENTESEIYCAILTKVEEMGSLAIEGLRNHIDCRIEVVDDLAKRFMWQLTDEEARWRLDLEGGEPIGVTVRSECGRYAAAFTLFEIVDYLLDIVSEAQLERAEPHLPDGVLKSIVTDINTIGAEREHNELNKENWMPSDNDNLSWLHRDVAEFSLSSDSEQGSPLPSPAAPEPLDEDGCPVDELWDW